MAILECTTDFTGQVGVVPRLVRLLSSDTLATVGTTGYCNNLINTGIQLSPTDFVFCSASDGFDIFNPSISGSNITLIPLPSASGWVVLPVVTGHFAVFANTTEGQVKDSGFLPSDATKTTVVMLNGAVTANHVAQFSATNGTIQDGGVLGTAAAKAASDNTQPSLSSVVGSTVTNDIMVAADAAGSLKTFAAGSFVARTFATLQSGADANAGELRVYPSTTTSGRLRIFANNNSGNFDISLSNGSMGQASNIHISDPGNATAYINTALIDSSTTPVGTFIPGRNINLTAAGLASGGSITIQASSGSMQFKIRDVHVNNSGPGLSGGGGNRLIQITDGTSVWNGAGITAALAGTPVNTLWGGTGNPIPTSISMDTPTAAGASLVAKYAGGTTDYTTGSFTITVILERVA